MKDDGREEGSTSDGQFRIDDAVFSLTVWVLVRSDSAGLSGVGVKFTGFGTY